MDIVALGEILIDFVEMDNQSEVLPSYVAQPGGAPANVLCTATKFSKQCALIGKVGQDKFGDILVKTLQEHNVETKHVIVSSEYNTTLAFVHLDANGDRSFSFYREGCADTMLLKEEIDVSLLEECRLFHFGSNSLTTDGNKHSTEYALKIAKQKGAIISFDPNIRTNLWKDTNQIRPAILHKLSFVDILKLSEEELYFLTGLKNNAEAMKALYATYEIPLIVVTLGGQGAMYLYKENIQVVPGLNVKVVDTTGAGDCFVGALLANVLDEEVPINQLTEESLYRAVNIANTVGALSTMKNGAIPSIPSIDRVKEFLGD